MRRSCAVRTSGRTSRSMRTAESEAIDGAVVGAFLGTFDSPG
ncbi:hypothetical protein [Streptomyces sp. NPDC088762]